MIVKFLKRRINILHKRIREHVIRRDSLSGHGYWALGYYTGQLSVMENWLDFVQESKGDKSPLTADDFNVCDHNPNGQFVRIEELNAMIEAGALTVNREVLKEFQKMKRTEKI